MKSRTASSAILAIFRKFTTQQSAAWNLDVNRWDWAAGVGLWGVIKCAEAFPGAGFEAFIETWSQRNAGKYQTGSVNNVIPANAPHWVSRRSGSQACRAVADTFADWCLHRALRTSNGGWAHVWEGGLEEYRHQLWADSVFMAGLFLARYGIERGRPECLDEALRQVQLHVDTLFDPQERLFFHGFDCASGRNIGEQWGRGNGWMVAALADLIGWLEPADPRRRALTATFQTVMARALELRSSDGRLRTLLVVPASYLETTCTALFGYAALRGAATGLLDARFQAWGSQIVETLTPLVDAAGRIADCSYGTNPDTREVYMTRPFDQSLYADGIMLMLLSEAA